MKFDFRKEFVVGLDLGSSSIKVAQLVRRKEGLALVKVGLKEIADSDDPAVREKEISSALKDLLQGVEIRKSQFVVTFNGPEMGMRVLTVPLMPKEELREGIQLEAKNYFPFSLEDSLIDVEPYGEVVAKGVKKQRVVVAVAPRKTVTRMLDLLKKIGIRPFALLPIPAAFQKLVGASDGREGKIFSWVDIGAHHTELAIFKGKDLVFSRRIPVTGIDFSRALTGALVSDRGKIELGLEEAEKIKREVGIPAEGEPRVIEDKISSPQILSMLRSPLERLMSEIERCFDYYREESGGETVDAVFLFGRGALLKGLPFFLSEGLGIEVKVGNPLERLKIEAQVMSLDQGFAPLSAALGAALSFGKGLNLLPPEIKEETQRAFQRASVQSLTAGLILILAFLYIGMRIQIGNFQKRITVARLELASLESVLEKAEAQNLVRQVLADEPYWEDVLKELSNLIPKEIYLTELAAKGHRISLKGVIVSRNSERVLSDFTLNLEKGIFKNVKLITSRETTDPSASEFELEAWVD